MNAVAKTSRGTARPSVGPLLLVVVIATFAGALAFQALVYGPAIREKADRFQAEQTNEENRALCERLGIAHGSERFTVCAEVLLDVRRLEAKRVYSETAGIL